MDLPSLPTTREDIVLGFETSSPLSGAGLNGDFEFENLKNSGGLLAQPKENVVDWARGACTIIEDMVETDPVKPDEVDGVEILCFMVCFVNIALPSVVKNRIITDILWIYTSNCLPIHKAKSQILPTKKLQVVQCPCL